MADEIVWPHFWLTQIWLLVLFRPLGTLWETQLCGCSSTVEHQLPKRSRSLGYPTKRLIFVVL